MIIRTPTDLGAAIRERRKLSKLRQEQLAAKIGVSRQWVIEVEKGKPRAEIGLILRALEAVGITLRSVDGIASDTPSSGRPKIDLDAIVDAAKTRK